MKGRESSLQEFNEDEITLARNMRADAESMYAKRNEQIYTMRHWRYNEVEPDIPAGYKSTAKRVKLPLAADVIDRMVSIINESDIKIIVPQAEPGITSKRNSSKREKWSDAVIKQMEIELGRHVLNLVTENQIADGIGVLKVIYKPENWSNMPSVKSIFGEGRKVQDLDADEIKELMKKQDNAKKSFALPITFVDVDPTTYYPFLGPDGKLECVIEINERPLRALQSKYRDDSEISSILSHAGLAQAEQELKALPMVKTWECWTKDYYTFFVNDTPVQQFKNKMGRPPYFECVARERSSRDPARAFVPPVYQLIEIIESIQNFLTMGQNVMYLFAYPTPITTTPANVEIAKGGDLKPKAVKFEVGKHHVLYQGQEIKFLTPPVEHIKVMEQWIDRLWRMYETLSGLGPALKGIGGADQPGYAINQLIQASMMTLKPAVDSKRFMMQQLIGFIWDIIENVIADTVWVHGENPNDRAESETKKRGKYTWIGLGPGDIQGYYKVDVEINPMVDAQRIAKGSFGADMHQRGLLDAETVIEDFLGYNQPEEILDKIWVERAMAPDTPLGQKAQMDALARAGIAIVKPEAQQSINQGPDQAGQLSPPPMPGQPTEAMQNADTAQAMMIQGRPAPNPNEGQQQPMPEMNSSFQ
jgi:hypothetical protein